MSNFFTPDGPLRDLFITDADILDRYVGNQLWIWGNGSSGNLGDNTLNSKSSPIQTVSGGTNWKLVSGGVGIGQLHAAAIKTDGTLWMWGSNLYGQLGDNTIIFKSSPIQTVSGGTNWKLVSGGGYFTAAIKTDGTLWTWGRNDLGSLGDNTTIFKSSPIQTVSGGTNWKQVSCGSFHTAAIKTNGTLWTWGSSTSGQLGDNTLNSKSSPVQTVAGGTNWKQVAGGNYHTAAIKTDGTLWTWGANADSRGNPYAILGDNTLISRSSPVQTVSGGTNWKLVSCGYLHTAAIKTDGTLWTWGTNGIGQLGDNTAITRSSPVQTIAGGTNWKQVAGGYDHTAAIKTDGTLWTWGDNTTNGRLGDNTTIRKSSPVQTVAGGTNWKQVACGQEITTAVTYTES
jgi:alpha-tubulin suppressor-like RCC1 family protein